METLTKHAVLFGLSSFMRSSRAKPTKLTRALPFHLQPTKSDGYFDVFKVTVSWTTTFLATKYCFWNQVY